MKVYNDLNYLDGFHRADSNQYLNNIKSDPDLEEHEAFKAKNEIKPTNRTDSSQRQKNEVFNVNAHVSARRELNEEDENGDFDADVRLADGQQDQGELDD